MINNVFKGTHVSTRMNHAALNLVVTSNTKLSIAVRSNTRSYRKVDDLDRGAWTYLAFGISRNKLEMMITSSSPLWISLYQLLFEHMGNDAQWLLVLKGLLSFGKHETCAS